MKDSPPLVEVKIKTLLSHHQTKADLTAYLADFSIKALADHNKKYIVVYDSKCVSSIPEYPDNLRTFDQEEADALILMQAKYVTDVDPFTELVMLSPDTDVFLLLIHFYPKLCTSTTFRTGTCANIRNINIQKVYKALGPDHAEAIYHWFSRFHWL